MKFFLILTCSLLIHKGFSQNSNIVSYGIEDSILIKDYPELKLYNSKINFPPFTDWSIDGKKMLFNGGKYIYTMRTHDSEIKEYKKLDHYLSSYLSPDQKKFIYLEDENGDENYQLFLYNIRSKKGTKLSNRSVKSYDPFWSSDGKHIAYKSNKVNPDCVDLFIRDIENSNQEKIIFKDFSDDGLICDWKRNTIVVIRVISENNKELYLINSESGVVEHINSGKENIAYSTAKILPNKNGCLLVSDEYSEFLQLHYYDFDTKVFSTITKDISWDVEDVSIDKKGKRAVFTINQNGFSKLYTLNLNTFKYELVKGLPEGIIEDLKFDPKKNKVGFNFYSSHFKRKIYSYDIDKKVLKNWLRKGVPQKDSINFIKARHFAYVSTDKDTNVNHTIPAFIYEQNKTSTPSPVFIEIHGGPEYQVRAKFNSFYQYLINELGITVIVPNIRGSNGYGKSYMKLDDGFNRENAIEDVGALLNWIDQQKHLDANKVIIYGESYGGYVTLSSLAAYGSKIKCGIDVVGISNWLTYLENTSGYRRDLRRVEFGDERHNETRKFLKDISPLSNVDKISSPLLIFQGLNDPRVNYQESVQMYESLKQKDKEVWFLMANNEGHGFQKYENYKLQQSLIVSFLKKHLLQL